MQILINLSHFTQACTELEALLSSARPESSVTLTATSVFSTHQKTAEKRIFELVNSKIDDLVETAEYDFTRTGGQASAGPSTYLRQATMFLQSIMGSTLITLPKEISGLVYFDALNHLASCILGLMVADSVTAITKDAVGDLWVDVEFLRRFVREIGRPELGQVFEELRQTVELMRSGNGDEFYEVGTRMKKYANVDPLNGPMLLEKYVALLLSHFLWGVVEIEKSVARDVGMYTNWFMTGFTKVS